MTTFTIAQATGDGRSRYISSRRVTLPLFSLAARPKPSVLPVQRRNRRAGKATGNVETYDSLLKKREDLKAKQAKLQDDLSAAQLRASGGCGSVAQPGVRLRVRRQRPPLLTWPSPFT